MNPSLQFSKIDDFTVVCSVTWPLNGSEAGGGLVLIKTSLVYCVNQFVLVLTSWHLLNNKSREVCIKVRSPSASPASMGQVTKHRTVKWPICPKYFKITKGSNAVNISA